MKPFIDSILFTLKVNRASSCHLELARDFLPTISTFAQKELYPLNKIGDRHGCVKHNEKDVSTPPGFKDAYKIYKDNGWHGISFPQNYNGSSLPNSLNIIKSEILATANWSWSMYPGLGLGAANTILQHGTEQLKRTYLSKLVSGDYLGTMCLTEPQCGSDLSLINTKATCLKDGTYAINGTKIFISCGNHDLTDNIVHCVLARLEGAPAGVKGISLFLVPKYKSSSFNNVNTVRLENKMGCHGSSTCELFFDDARGYLIGEKNKGLNHMFTFINTSRIGVALQSVAASEMAYQLALDYATHRRSMRSLDKTKQELKFPADRIIIHPDIQNMLNTIQCFAEGGRSMLYECALLADVDMNDTRLGFLTPILKGFLSERGIESTQLGIQIFGGHGYIFENGMEQLARDTRISSIYEGTTGIQALDLLARKILLQNMKPLDDFCKRTRYELSRYPFDMYTLQLFRMINEWQLFTYNLARKINKSKNYESIGRIAVDYLLYSGYIVMGLHMIRMNRLDSSSSKRKLIDHYFNYILPRTRTHISIMRQYIK